MDSGFANANGVQSAVARLLAAQERVREAVRHSAARADQVAGGTHCGVPCACAERRASCGDGARDALLGRRECAEALLEQRDRVVLGYAAAMCIIGAAGSLSVANLSNFGSTQSS
jgi:hypothetical protein